MTPRRTRIHLAAAAAAATLTLLAACGADGHTAADSPAPVAVQAPGGPQCEAGQGIVVVLGSHQAFPAGIPEQLACAVGNAVKAGKPVAVVTSEGSPRTIVPSYMLPNTSNSDDNRNLEVAKALQPLKQQIDDGATPHSNGDDLVSAMDIAADLAHASNASEMYVVDSGLTDTGAIRMTQAGALLADPAEVAAQLEKQRQCPDLRGITVHTFGLGYGIDPQPLLTPADRTSVTALWLQVVRGCGGRSVDVPGPVTGAGPRTTFTVTPVQPSGYVLPVGPSRSGKTAKPAVFRSQLGFTSDGTDFARPEEANEVLNKIAGQMRDNPTWHLQVTGATANGPTRWPSLKQLGQARADAVKKALVERGVAASRISTRGLGYTAHPPQVDARTAALNRTISLRYRL